MTVASPALAATKGANPLQIFAFASPRIRGEVEGAITGCGYRVVCRPAFQLWGWTAGGHHSVPIVVYECGWNEAPSLEEFLRSRPSGPWMGIFTGDCSRLARDCCEFVFWPAPLEELKLRLERFAGPCEAPHESIDDDLAQLFATFNVVGKSLVFRRVLDQTQKIGNAIATTLIEGETGTGKELFARAIHYMGARRDRPFIAVNCGAIPETLIESEFFGHERGAFTDARERRIGTVEQATGGTLFLDEIESLCPRGQVALLRLLQEQEFRRVGSSSPQRADVRVIAASNKPLRDMVREGICRADLYYRLNILSVTIPPLRERQEDIEPLSRRFLDSLRSRYNGRFKSLSRRSLDWMERYEWPGNVRELENLLHRAYVFNSGDVLDIDHPRETEGGAAESFRRDFQTEKSIVIEQFEREYLTWVMATSHGNVTRAAKIAGKERRAMGKLLKKYQIGRPAF